MTKVEQHPVEPVKVADVMSETAPVTPVESSQLPVLVLKEPADQLVEVQLSDAPATASVIVEPTSAYESELVTSTVIDSTTLIIPAALELTIMPTSVQETQVVSEPTVYQGEKVAEVPVIQDQVVGSEVTKEAESIEPLSASVNPVVSEANQDSTGDVVAVTEKLFDVTEKVQPAEDVASESLVQEEHKETAPEQSDARIEAVTDQPVANEVVQNDVPSDSSQNLDEPIITTVVPPVAASNNVDPNPVDLVRNDLVESSTSATVVQSDEAQPTSAPVVKDSQDVIYADPVETVTSGVVPENGKYIFNISDYHINSQITDFNSGIKLFADA